MLQHRLCQETLRVRRRPTAEHHIDQGDGAINGAVEAAPLRAGRDAGIVNRPTVAHIAAPAPP